MTNKKASDDSMAERIASGNTSVSSMPEVSIHTFLPLDSIAAAKRVTKAESCREYETKTSAMFPPVRGGSSPAVSVAIVSRTWRSREVNRTHPWRRATASAPLH